MTIARRHCETFLPSAIRVATVRLTRPDPWPEFSANHPDILFIHVPRAAGGSIRRSLGMPRSGHVPAYVYADSNRQQFESAFKFAFVRNPWDRMISAYHRVLHNAKNPKTTNWGNRNLRRFSSFKHFVMAMEDPVFRWTILAYPHFRPQHEWIEVQGRASMNFLGRFETLKTDYLRLRETLGLQQELEHVHQSPHADYRSYYDTESIELVGQIYAKDIKLFGYHFQ